MSSRDLVVAAAGASAPSDPNFKNVSLLLTGDGTNGAQNNTFLDSSTNNFTITRNGNTTQGTFSPYGNLWSNYFDGSGDYLYTASNTAFGMGTGDFTWEAWLFPISWPSAGNYSCILQIDGTGLYIGLNNSGFGLRQSGTANIISYGTNPTANTWTHVAIVRSGTTCTMYYNGVSVATATSSANFSAGNAWIGSDATPGNYYTGYASNMRLVKGTAVYTSNFTPSTTPLTAVSGTSLLTCQSNRFIDNSSNNFTLTVNGNTSVQRFSPFNPTAPYSAATIGGSGYFDGTGDYLNTPSTGQFAPAGDFTISCWYYPTALTTYQTVLANYTGNFTTDWIIEFTSTGVAYVYKGGGVVITGSAGTVKIGQWHYITLTRSGTSVTLTVNGSTIGSYTQSGTFGSPTKTIAIGAYVNGSETITGYMSDVRLYDGSAITSIPTAPLTAISGTNLLLNFTNAGIPDAAMMNDLETVGNAQVSTGVKKYGTGSLAFDGSGDYLILPQRPTLNILSGDFTIECWVYPTANTGLRTIIGQWKQGGLGGYLLYTTGTSFKFEFNEGAVNLTSSTTFTTNTWYHIAIVRYGSSFNMYVNGTSVAFASYSGTQVELAVNTTMGNYYNNSGVIPTTNPDFNGYIDDLRITKGYARYTANFTPPAQALPTN